MPSKSRYLCKCHTCLSVFKVNLFLGYINCICQFIVWISAKLVQWIGWDTNSLQMGLGVVQPINSHQFSSSEGSRPLRRTWKHKRNVLCTRHALDSLPSARLAQHRICEIISPSECLSSTLWPSWPLLASTSSKEIKSTAAATFAWTKCNFGSSTLTGSTVCLDDEDEDEPIFAVSFWVLTNEISIEKHFSFLCKRKIIDGNSMNLLGAVLQLLRSLFEDELRSPELLRGK